MLGEEAEGGGGEAVGAEEREEEGEDFGVAVDEDRVGLGGGPVGEGGEEGVGAAGLEGGDGGGEELAADVELDSVGGVGVEGSFGIWVFHFADTVFAVNELMGCSTFYSFINQVFISYFKIIG